MKFYLFDDQAKYIKDVIELLYMGSYKCISFLWAADFWEASLAIDELNDSGNPRQKQIVNAAILILVLVAFHN